ncbi:hypothetical protein GUITHDRAFT_73088 [Guillardia theta CCMP2712]|uniref:GDT1 family protein n=1 Tax=Guillardia theta (strain CCMP2712) TaxID=905079 RepID=L1J5Z4_GUITC|nr:hypothetical protein GUITHDRAFT_73088 [Guillardia theta CCMP2712]EKX43505.1 hypothetical protein GUITHDRAFT_73088 [Guillardia theta CCMP2712]|eukprot:XP_005830485.1 hypothetical protein GUITHDRAFT_73088 [Guillardia theta CCMP2712]
MPDICFQLSKNATSASKDSKSSIGGHIISGYADAFISSLMMIIVSELGDKTFFIAAIMAMKHSRWIVFSGAIAALALMTVLSSAFGYLLPNILPRAYTHYASIVLFIIFGARLLKEGLEMESGKVSEELEELERKQMSRLLVCDVALRFFPDAVDVDGNNQSNDNVSFTNGILWQSFILTFLAEWGDRSQIATIALAAHKDPWGVTIGGTLGHAICTGLAVLGGRMLASRISEKTVALSGGTLFLLFAIHGILQVWVPGCHFGGWICL